MLSLKSCCFSVNKSLEKKTLTNNLKFYFSFFILRRSYSDALNEPLILDDIECSQKIIYNEILSKHKRRDRLQKKRDDYCEPLFLKCLKNKNNILIKQTEADTSEQKNSNLINFPYNVTKSFLQSSQSNAAANVISKSIQFLTPSDNEKVTLPTFKSSNFENFPKHFGNALRGKQIEDSEIENDNIDFEVQFGTSDPNIPISSVPCGGCGALLHCTDTSIPGFLPKEVFSGLTNRELQSQICRRCHFLKEFDVALGINVSADEYPKIISQIKKKRAFIILMIDILDFPCSIWPGISNLIGSFQPVIIAANKIDLLVQEGDNFQQHLKKSLLKALYEREMNLKNVKDIVFISAKTGFGIENLISSLNKNWANRGDVYVVGCTNVGKSTLFNTLIQSDFCNENATVSMQRATISAWPGTTLNLLKFPIPKLTKRRLFFRRQRLELERQEKIAFEKFKEELLMLKGTKQTPLQEHVGQTFSYNPIENNSKELFISSQSVDENMPKGLDPDEFKGRWCFDTPGVVNLDQIVNILTTSELLVITPKDMIIPRNFHLKQGATLFIGGLARIDFVEGNESVWFTVFASKELPVTVTKTEDADFVYEKLLGSPLFRVPVGDKLRLSKWPDLAFKTFDICGKLHKESASDIVLSSVGWVSVTTVVAHSCKIKAWTPEGRGLYLRDAIIRNGSSLRGKRISKSPAYETTVEVIKDISISKEPSEMLS